MTPFESDRMFQFERELRTFLENEAGLERPDYLPDVLVRSVAMRQRRPWAFPSRWIPMATLTQERVEAHVRWRPVLALITVALLAIAAAIAISASRPRVPAPFGIAGNGLVASTWNGDIRVSDPATGTTKLLIGGPDVDSNPVWSLDGMQLAFVRRIDKRPLLFVASADGSHVRQLSSEPMSAIDAQGFGWSPDGRQVAFESDQGGTHAVVVAATDGSGSRLVTPSGVNVDSVAWRPGTSTLLYRGLDPASGGRGLHLVGADGTGDTAITQTPGRDKDYEYAVWSPDGAWIAFTRADGPGLPQRLHVVDASGGNETSLSLASGMYYPEWSPDGRKIAYFEPHGLGARAAIASFDPARHALAPGGALGPWHAGFTFVWSPDATKLLEHDEVASTVTVIDVASGSSDTVNWQDAGFPSWQRVAP